MIINDVNCACGHIVSLHSSVTGLCVCCNCKLLRVPRNRASIHKHSGDNARNARVYERKQYKRDKYLRITSYQKPLFD